MKIREVTATKTQGLHLSLRVANMTPRKKISSTKGAPTTTISTSSTMLSGSLALSVNERAGPDTSSGSISGESARYKSGTATN